MRTETLEVFVCALWLYELQRCVLRYNLQVTTKTKSTDVSATTGFVNRSLAAHCLRVCKLLVFKRHFRCVAYVKRICSQNGKTNRMRHIGIKIENQN